uniref:Uncharacterized protein n=1 Tax=Arundo donax TaxID=35708 RepID=A0A0A9BL14_ARUDO
MALSLSQVGSHLTSTLQDGHHHHHPSPELLRLGGVSGGNSIAARLDHLLSPSGGASSFRLPQASSAFFLNAAAAADQDFGDDPGSGPHSFLQSKPFHGLMQLPDLQGNGAGGPGASGPGLFNLGFFANNGNSSGSSHEHASQGLMNNDQFSGGAGGGGGSETSAGGIFGGNFVGGGDHVPPQARLYNDQASMLPQMSATALLQKAAQMGATSSANGGGAASMLRGFGGSSSPHVWPAAPHMEQSEANLNDLMNSLAGGGVGAGGMFDPRQLCDMEGPEVKFGQGGGDMTRDFLGVGGGGIVSGISTPRGGPPEQQRHELLGGRDEVCLVLQRRQDAMTGASSLHNA